ncbi:MAG: hypothetical protein E6767_08305, partial [Dysgonomonas sp.]|nr:hypothetical protein [Dysgonomonas sp.]
LNAMIKFTKDSFIIEVKARTEPIEAYLETQKALLDLLECMETREECHNRIYILLKEMLPDVQHMNNIRK